jgi:hypothetical protein
MDSEPELRPFWGHVVGSAAFPQSEACLEVSGQPFQTVATAEGEIAPLGRTTFHATHCVTEEGRALDGRLTLTAEDGDELFLTYSAAMIEPQPLMVQKSELIIDGGTGRFAKASGQVLGMVYITCLGYDEPEWPIEMALVGTITF